MITDQARREAIMAQRTIDIDGLLKSGWRMQDWPAMEVGTWKDLLIGLGEEGQDYILLTEARYTRDGKEAMRGQMMIAPSGLKNVGRWAAEWRAKNSAETSEPKP